MDNDKIVMVMIGIFIGWAFCSILFGIEDFYGPINDESGGAEPLANKVCELKYGTYALSYEGGVLECSKINQENFVMDLNEEGKE